MKFSYGEPDFVIDRKGRLSCPKNLISFSSNKPIDSGHSRISMLSTDKTNEISRITINGKIVSKQTTP